MFHQVRKLQETPVQPVTVSVSQSVVTRRQGRAEGSTPVSNSFTFVTSPSSPG